MYMCVSEYVPDWQIHSSNVNENIYCYIYTKSHNNEMMLPNFKETHLDNLLIITMSFYLCELERIIRAFPVMPNNAIKWTKDWIMIIQTIEMWIEAMFKPPGTMPIESTVKWGFVIIIISCTEFHSIMIRA